MAVCTEGAHLTMAINELTDRIQVALLSVVSARMKQNVYWEPVAL